MSRTLSYSEITKALTCQAAWDFAYGGQLTGGDTLKRRQLAAILSDGRAWGAAVAAYHAHSPELFPAMHATRAMNASFANDVAEQATRGFRVEPSVEVDSANRMIPILEHYMSIATPLWNLSRLEDEINVPILSRAGGRASSLYRFMCRIDGYVIDENGNQWIVEFKLRNQLQDAAQIVLGRQPRWYAWAHQQATGAPVVGVIVEERLNEAPKPPRLVQGKRKGQGKIPSHAKDQLCRVEDYIALCQEYDEEPLETTLDVLRARKWQQRVPIPFRPSELAEAGEELVSAAQTIRDLDGGRFPIRNAKPSNCRSCEFMPICANPRDEFFVDVAFERTIPKRLRTPEPTSQPSVNVETNVPW